MRTENSAADYDAVEAAAGAIRAAGAAPAAIGLILGSGLGGVTASFTDRAVVPYAGIPGWPASTVVGHAGQLVAGTFGGARVVALSGRAHYYEGYRMDEVTFGTRVLAALGVRTLIVTNAAGGINPDFTPGTLMVIDDHLNLMGTNPLIGPNDERFGPRFPDMTEVYARRLRALAMAAAGDRGMTLAHGVYVAVHGPSYETPAEIRYLRTIGADAVGMSTVPEALVARHMGIEVLGISCIANPAAGVLPEPLRHDEVMEVAYRVRDTFVSLLEGIVERL